MTGEGLELLYDAMAERLAEDVVHHYVKLSPAEGWLRARFYQTGAVVAERWLDGGEPALEIRMQERDWCQLLGHAAVSRIGCHSWATRSGCRPRPKPERYGCPSPPEHLLFASVVQTRADAGSFCRSLN